jgi:hypothetical protein
MVNSNTPYFRIAMSIATVWIIIFAIISYDDYSDGYRDVDAAYFPIPESAQTTCEGEIVYVEDQLVLRKTPAKERDDCIHQMTKIEREIAAKENHLLRNRALNEWGLYGILPAFILLLIVALWTSIVQGAREILRRYVSWIRHGREGKSTDDQSGSFD